MFTDENVVAQTKDITQPSELLQGITLYSGSLVHVLTLSDESFSIDLHYYYLLR